eukprot:gene24210-biopygen5894
MLQEKRENCTEGAGKIEIGTLQIRKPPDFRILSHVFKGGLPAAAGNQNFSQCCHVFRRVLPPSVGRAWLTGPTAPAPGAPADPGASRALRTPQALEAPRAPQAPQAPRAPPASPAPYAPQALSPPAGTSPGENGVPYS